MKLTNTFTYNEFECTTLATGRHYLVNNIPLPSVTTVLSSTKDTTHLDQWVASVGKDEAERIKNEASTLGSAMHSNIEQFIFSQPMSGSYMAKTLANLIIKNGLKNVTDIWGVESSLFYEPLYAGRCDMIALHNNIPSIIDFKNSKEIKKKEWIEDYFLQLAAYAWAHNKMFDTTISRGVIMMATRNAQYLEFIIEGDEFEYYRDKWIDRLSMYYDLVDSGKST